MVRLRVVCLVADLKNSMFVIKYKKVFLSISAVLVAASIALVAVFGLNLGIDFRGGSQAEVSYPDGRPDNAVIMESLATAGFENVLLQPTGENNLFVKTVDLSDVERQDMFAALAVDGATVEEVSFTSIGPSVGKELQRKAIIAVIIVAIAIIFFIAYTFRRVSKPVSSWKYGLIAVITLLHDVILTTGVFVVISLITGAELDTLFVVALLTVLGLSVNDTIVVFDRVRENLHEKRGKMPFRQIVGESLSQTFGRSILCWHSECSLVHTHQFFWRVHY
jgi:preprotein translocase subunit SecF